MICAVCAAGVYCWLHDHAAIDDNHGSTISPRTAAPVLAFGMQQGVDAEAGYAASAPPRFPESDAGLARWPSPPAPASSAGVARQEHHTAIEWTHRPGTIGETWNPTTGCDRISAGCDHCYALTLARRLKAMGSARYQSDGDPATSGPGFGIAEHPDVVRQPYGWRKPRTVFVNSMSDLFHHGVSDQFIRAVWETMAATDRHRYLILTKRPARARSLLTRWARDAGPLPNVELGASIESDEHVARAHHLRETPAAVRFLSAEPLLGPLPSLDLTGIDQLIVGGESGPGARPMDLGWVRELIGMARDAGTAVFVKQLGTRWAGSGKGGNWDLWPQDLRIREFPAGVDRG